MTIGAKLFIIALILLFGSIMIGFSAEPRITNQKNLDLVDSAKKTEPLKKTILNLCQPEENKKRPNPILPIFNKNDWDSKKNIVWRDHRPNDGVNPWYHDESLGVYWRYLRPNENPITLTTTQLLRPQEIYQNCPT